MQLITDTSSDSVHIGITNFNNRMSYLYIQKSMVKVTFFQIHQFVIPLNSKSLYLIALQTY